MSELFRDLKKIVEILKSKIKSHPKSKCESAKHETLTAENFDPIVYWRARAKRHGVRSVLNLGHKRSQVGKVTDLQRQRLFPILSALLDGSEKTALDFGCGPGRFTGDLAQTIQGKAIGVDISAELIALAPRTPDTCFLQIQPGQRVFSAATFDVVFCCLTLGGIPDGSLKAACEALSEHLSSGALLFLVENTQPNKPSVVYWNYRSAAHYRALFPDVRLELIATYDDLGEEISILAGRRDAPCCKKSTGTLDPLFR